MRTSDPIGRWGPYDGQRRAARLSDLEAIVNDVHNLDRLTWSIIPTVTVRPAKPGRPTGGIARVVFEV